MRGAGFSVSRRRFLLAAGAAAGGLGAAAVLGGCGTATEGALSGDRVGPGSPLIAQVEGGRRAPGQRAVAATLDAQVGPVDLGGPVVTTWTYSGQLPGREIRLRRGELLRAQLANQLPAPTTVHWHGIALRNDMDGVPVLTQPEIAPGAAMGYEFTVPDPGTYWFHPHVGPQLDRGLYAPLIIEDPADGGYDQELVVVFDDWLDGTGRTPDQVLADLQAHGMGGGAGGMGGMSMAHSPLLGGDAGDVSYPYYLANGRVAAAPRVFTAKPGHRIRLRMINAGGDTAFRVGIPATPMTVTHTDGYPVTPTRAEAVLLGMGERVDAVITMPTSAIPLLGLAEGKNGAAALLLQPGTGPAPDLAAAAASLTARPVTMLAALPADPAVALPARDPDVVADMTLAGPGNGYRWTINDQTYDPNRGVEVHQGQRVRLRYINTTTMFHPMHLHGHTFGIHTPTGPGPRKDTAIVLPGQTLEVDFDATNPGQWLTHCHNIYHGESAMMTVVSYTQ
jgi:FtsP/CotA-like multicopper oxidase with cupredoxin domain